MGIGKNIERLRKLNKMTQSELGEKLHVSNKAVSSWEKDRTEPNIGMIEAMCEIFKCQKTDLIDGITQPKSYIDYSVFSTNPKEELIAVVEKMSDQQAQATLDFVKRLEAYAREYNKSLNKSD